MSEKKLKIFQMNEFDWWADFDHDAAISNYRKWKIEVCGSSADEVEIDARELTDVEMNQMKFYYSDSEETTTFANDLKYRIAAGENGPQFFASTEH